MENVIQNEAESPALKSVQGDVQRSALIIDV